MIGIAQLNDDILLGGSLNHIGKVIGSCGWYLHTSGNIYYNGSYKAITAYTYNDILMFAYDANSGKFWVGKNGSWVTSDPALDGTPTISYAEGGFSDYDMRVAASFYSVSAGDIYLMPTESLLKYSIPSGFSALG